ncbi:hypothetical protein D3C60_14015 [Bacillus velezensis]|nr:hypothetical protein D3C60_14015 [Bacillus velezensis]POR12621.1 hypothetical protein B9W23_16780 [Bacillus velezensis]
MKSLCILAFPAKRSDASKRRFFAKYVIFIVETDKISSVDWKAKYFCVPIDSNRDYNNVKSYL